MRLAPESNAVSTLLLMLLLGTSLACGQTDAKKNGESGVERKALAPVTPVALNDVPKFPAMANLNSEAGGAAQIDLNAEIGKKPVALIYWIAGNPRADRMLQQAQALSDDLGADKLGIYALVIQRPGREADAIAKHLQQLDIRLPVLDDVDFVTGRMLQVQSAPFVAMFDAEGRLRLSNGASMLQVLEYNMNLEQAFRRAADNGKVGGYGYLPRYHPVKELVGQQCPDFKAPLLANSIEQRWHSLLDGEKLNVLIFWSVDCPHCRTTLPDINKWVRSNPEGVNVITAAKVTNDTTKIKTREFCELNGFVIPTLQDQDMRIANLFQITSTPTILIIGPDGVIDSVILSNIQDFGKTMEEKKRALLKG